MSSANGVRLDVQTRAGNIFSLTAAWAAPYFVYFELGVDAMDVELAPILYHAQSLDDARRFFTAHGNCRILDAEFNEVQS